MASAYGTAKGAFDGTRLVINTHMGRPSMDAKIWDAKRNPKYTKLSLTGALGVHGYQQQEPLSIDRDLAVAMCEPKSISSRFVLVRSKLSPYSAPEKM